MEGEAHIVPWQPALLQLSHNLAVDVCVIDGAGQINVGEIDLAPRALCLQPLTITFRALMTVIGQEMNAIEACVLLDGRRDGPDLPRDSAFRALVVGVADPCNKPRFFCHEAMIKPRT